MCYNYGSRSSIGRAELWRCLGCKFKSYLEQDIYILCITYSDYITTTNRILSGILLRVMVELVNMNSLGLFDI